MVCSQGLVSRLGTKVVYKGLVKRFGPKVRTQGCIQGLRLGTQSLVPRMDSMVGYQGLVQRFGPKLVYQCWVPIPKAVYPMFSPNVLFYRFVPKIGS